MGKLSACLAIALAACGSSNAKKPDAQIVVPDAPPDAKVFMDAPIDAPPVFDLACQGNTTYPNASANITISGTAYQVDVMGLTPSITPLADAKVDACDPATDCSSPLATSTSDASGAYSDGPIATTNMMHLGVYLKITPPPAGMGSGSGSGSTDEPVLEYPGEDLTADFMGAPIFTLTPGAVAALGIAGCTLTGTNTIMGVAVTDCSNTPITDSQNTTITLKQGGTTVTGTTTINLGQFTSMAKGTYLICNVPSGTINVSATYKGMSFLAHDVTTAFQTITATQVRPGV